MSASNRYPLVIGRVGRAEDIGFGIIQAWATLVTHSILEPYFAHLYTEDKNPVFGVR